MPGKKFLLIDSNALLHRAFHALPHLTTKEGEPINAVYGFTSILIKAFSQINPSFVAAAFDRKEPTFRHKEFVEYKAKRPPLPSELSIQIPKAKEVLSVFAIPIYEKEEFEADDIIGTIAEIIKEKGFLPIILTGDLDTLQLVNSKTKVYTLKKGITETVIFDERTVKKRYNLLPNQVIDLKALRGDPSDNIPGVPGIGEKTASFLISEFSSLENLYKEIENQTSKINKLPEKLVLGLKNYKEQAFLAKKLVTIKKDVAIDFKLEECLFPNYKKEDVFTLFQKFGFKSLLSRLPENKTQVSVSLFENEKESLSLKHSGTNYQLIQRKEDFEKFLKIIKNQKIFAFDLETTSPQIIEAKIVGLAFSFAEKEAFYIPCNHQQEKQLNLNYVLNNLKPILENPKIKKCGHNLKYDMGVLLKYNIHLANIAFDSMIASYLLSPTSRAHDLDSVVFAELGIQTTSLSEIIGKGKDQKRIEEIPARILGPYSCEDADMTLRLFHYLSPKIEKESLSKVFYEIEIPLIPVLSYMEMWGVKIDENFLKDLSLKISRQISILEEEIFKKIGWKFNLNSPQQLSIALFEVLNLPKEVAKKTKTGVSTAASQLEKLKDFHPAVNLILKYRELVKLKTTYIDTLPSLKNPQTGRVHTNFNQTITATGRLSSSNPNLQNIPAQKKWGFEIRKAFIAEKDFVFISADYSQIELRIIASLANDRRMIMAFEAGEDIHTRTATEIYGAPFAKVTKEMRRGAKTINFGIIYGMSSYGLAEALKIPQEEAREYIEKYFTLHQGIKEYIQNTLGKAREFGYVETIFGRKRSIPEIHSSIFNIRSAAERMAINMPVQGSAADIIKKAMIEIFSELSKTSPSSKMILQVHDELLFEVPKKDLKKISQLIKEKMEKVIKLKVPLIVNLSWGKNWAELKKL